MPSSPPPRPISSRAIRHLRALGHALEPIILVGKLGLTESVVEATQGALRDHELVKIRLPQQTPGERRALAAELGAATQSVVAQVLGRTVLLYKRHPKEPTIVLPDDKPRRSA